MEKMEKQVNKLVKFVENGKTEYAFYHDRYDDVINNLNAGVVYNKQDGSMVDALVRPEELQDIDPAEFETAFTMSMAAIRFFAEMAKFRLHRIHIDDPVHPSDTKEFWVERLNQMRDFESRLEQLRDC